ncbi:MAG TPA: hypothetical protein VHD87_11115 [Acidimicrobiales bacterium]|nr:hypothetical protein [Acidimicrobiales bacterium]
MQVETQLEAVLVDVEEATQPREEEHHHSWVGIREVDRPVSLASLTGVERRARDEELLFGQRADTFDALGELSPVPHVLSVTEGGCSGLLLFEEAAQAL